MDTLRKRLFTVSGLSLKNQLEYLLMEFNHDCMDGAMHTHLIGPCAHLGLKASPYFDCRLKVISSGMSGSVVMQKSIFQDGQLAAIFEV
jgi:hypothetical protein